MIGGPLAAQSQADLAWQRGDLRTAEQLYGARLAADSADQRALHRMGLIRGWAGKYAESLALLDRLLIIAPDNMDATLDRARIVAWRGDVAAAIGALDQLLARYPTFIAALRARAEFQSWAGQLGAALATNERILQITPDDPDAHREQAKLLTYSARYDAAAAIYDSLLRVDPTDREALLGLAQLLLWSGQLDSADAVYHGMLQMDPGQMDALRGRARAAAWGGDLVTAESRWQQTIERDPQDVPALVGLGQTLRWQGRDAAALQVIERAIAVEPGDRDARTELTWLRSALAPRTGVSALYESDSDGNRMFTLALRGAWRPHPRLELRGDAYRRDAEQVRGALLEHHAIGASVSLWGQVEPGWTAVVGVGASGSGVPGADPIGTARIDVTSPGRYPFGGTLGFARSAIDETATLINNRIYLNELSASGRYSPAPGWNVGGGISRAVLHGSETNRRVASRVQVTRRLTGPWTVGGSFRSMWYEKDLLEGYFDPNFYGLGELTARWLRDRGRWSLHVEVAPGLQQVTHDGPVRGAFRAYARAGLTLLPGREVGISASYSSAGIQSIAASSDYQYRAVNLLGSWRF